jgi:hypothetical protein
MGANLSSILPHSGEIPPGREMAGAAMDACHPGKSSRLKEELQSKLELPRPL